MGMEGMRRPSYYQVSTFESQITNILKSVSAGLGHSGGPVKIMALYEGQLQKMSDTSTS